VDTFALLTDDPGDVVLSSLQLLYDCNRSAIQQRVAIVDPWQDDAAGNGLCRFSSLCLRTCRRARVWYSCTPWRQLRCRGCQSACGCRWSRRGTSAETRLSGACNVETAAAERGWAGVPRIMTSDMTVNFIYWKWESYRNLKFSADTIPDPRNWRANLRSIYQKKSWSLRKKM